MRPKRPSAVLDTNVFVSAFGFGGRPADALLSAVRSRFVLVVSAALVKECDGALRRVLECAVAGDADIIVSGDRHLLALGEFRGIRIMRVAEFLDTLGEG